MGAEPIAITDNLNFGNPERPEIMGQIVRAIDGMALACKDLDFPVVSGNVSLYNETNGRAIPPTPTVGAVGLLADGRRRAGFGGLAQGKTLVLIGETKGALGASLYLREVLGREDGAPPGPGQRQSHQKDIGQSNRRLAGIAHMHDHEDRRGDRRR